MISRSDFIKSFGLGILSLALPEIPSRLVGNNEYTSASTGLSLRKPPHWQFVSALDVQKERENSQLPGGESTKEIATELAGFPLLVLTQKVYPDRGPTLIIWRQPAEEHHHAYRDNHGFSFVHQQSYELYDNLLHDYTICQKAAPVTFAGRPASNCIVSFREETEFDSWDVQLSSFMLRWQSSWLTFNFLDVKNGWGAHTKQEFSEIENSIRFRKPAINTAS